MNQENNQWNILYKAGSIAAVLMVIFIPIQTLIFIIWPPPATVDGWFALYQHNRIIGLLDMDLLLIVDQVLLLLIVMALSANLWQINPSLITISLGFTIVGVATYFASTSAFEMLTLSNRFATAATEMEKIIILSAGQSMLVNWQGSAFNVGYILAGLALIILAYVIRQSALFSKFTVWVGFILGFMSLIPPTAGMIGMIFALGSLIPLILWDILIAQHLFQISKK